MTTDTLPSLADLRAQREALAARAERLRRIRDMKREADALADLRKLTHEILRRERA